MSSPKARYEGPPWDHIAGDDYTVVWDPDDATTAGSTTAMRRWSDPLVVLRAGKTKDSDLILSSDGAEPGIILGGYTFPGDDGLVVPATDFAVPLLSLVILAASTVDLIPENSDYRDLYMEMEVIEQGVRSTKMRARRWRLWNELAVRGD